MITGRGKRLASAVLLGAALGAGMLISPSPAVVSTPAGAADECLANVQLPGPPPAFALMGLFGDTLRPTGAGITVAVIDSGVDATRPQLSGALTDRSRSLVGDDQRPDGLSDSMGHGTAVAGVIAARPAPGSGVVGVAPEAKLISLRVLRDTDDQSKEAGYGPDSGRLADAMRLAADAGSQVIAVALSDIADSAALRDATDYALGKGSLVVASAGNRLTTEHTDDSPRYPAAYPGVVSVTAVDTEGLSTDASIHGEHVDIAAPGQHVLTTSNLGGDCFYSVDAASSSFATAYVAGAAALVAEAHPDESPEEWFYRLIATADRPHPDQRDSYIGWGVVRPLAAIELRPDRSTRGPWSPFVNTNGAAIARQPSQVALHESAVSEPTSLIVVGAAAASVVLALTLGAVLRRRKQEGGLGAGSAAAESQASELPPASLKGHR